VIAIINKIRTIEHLKFIADSTSIVRPRKISKKFFYGMLPKALYSREVPIELSYYIKKIAPMGNFFCRPWGIP